MVCSLTISPGLRKPMVILLLGGILIGFVFAKIEAQVPSEVSDEDLETLRRKLDELALDRVAGPDDELPWEMEASAEIGEMKAREAVVQLSSESYKLGCIWVFRNLTDAKQPPVRACIYHQGEDYLVLPPGEYETTLHVGQADGISIALKPKRLELRKGNVYRSEFSLGVEELVARRIKAVLDSEQAKDNEDGF